MMRPNLKNKIVLITGASSGIGRDAARLFAREGCVVLLAARRRDRLVSLKKEIEKEGGSAAAIPVDVSRQSDVKRMAAEVLRKYGKVDILVNNAGYGRLDWLENLSPGRDIEDLIKVNLLGSMLVTRAMLPSMLTHHSGHIINMISVAGLLPAPMYSLYAASKFGLRGFTNSLRREVAPFGIKVSGIYPGPVVTEFSQRTGGDNAVRRIVKPGPWLYLSSEFAAKKLVELARRPRRMLIIPWYYRVLLWIDSLFPGLVDWILKVIIVKRAHVFPPEK
jgi:hypothetical protein